MNNLYSVRSAADRLGVSAQFLWREIREGRLPARKISARTTRITEADLTSFEAGVSR